MEQAMSRPYLLREVLCVSFVILPLRPSPISYERGTVDMELWFIKAA